jgi:hypothetical protein
MLLVPIPVKSDYTYDDRQPFQIFARYNNGRIEGINHGRVKFVVVPRIPHYPPGWELTGENLEGKWYGENVPMFVASGSSFVFNPIIDAELSGLQITDSTSSVLQPLTQASASSLTRQQIVDGEYAIFDVNGRPMYTAANTNPTENLVISAASLTDDNSLYVWIKANSPTITIESVSANVMNKTTYDSNRLSPLSGFAIIYTHEGGYRFQQLDDFSDPLDELSITAWTYINGQDEEKGDIPNLFGNQFGRLWKDMPPVFPTDDIPTNLTFSVQAKYRINDGFNYGVTNPQPETENPRDAHVTSLPPPRLLKVTAEQPMDHVVLELGEEVSTSIGPHSKIGRYLISHGLDNYIGGTISNNPVDYNPAVFSFTGSTMKAIDATTSIVLIHVIKDGLPPQAVRVMVVASASGGASSPGPGSDPASISFSVNPAKEPDLIQMPDGEEHASPDDDDTDGGGEETNVTVQEAIQMLNNLLSMTASVTHG